MAWITSGYSPSRALLDIRLPTSMPNASSRFTGHQTASVLASSAATPTQTSSCCKNPSPRLSLHLVCVVRHVAPQHPHPEGSQGGIREAAVGMARILFRASLASLDFLTVVTRAFHSKP